MQTLKDTQIYKLLSKRKTQNAIQYSGLLLSISNDLEPFLQCIKIEFPDYPDHGIQHAFRILDSLFSVLRDWFDNLTDTEIFCLCLSVLFHDTGMSLAGYAEKSELRKNHPKNASIVIDHYFENVFPNLSNGDRIRAVIKYVTKAHGFEINEFYKDNSFFNIDTIEGDNVRYSLLSVLLRIGDLLDLDEQRVNKLALILLPEIYSDEARNHNIRHLRVLRYQHDKSNIVIEVLAENIAQYRIWKNWLGYLEKEILYANSRFKEHRLFFPYPAISIKKSENANFEIEDIHFEIDDTGRIWDILSQSIYTNEFDFIREIIQNAIDATLFCTYKDMKIALSHPSPRAWDSSRISLIYVCFSMKNEMLYVIDRGVGMNRSDLRDFLFKVSSSGYSEKNIRDFPFATIAKYGIGFASCLINAEWIEIYTAKKEESSLYKVTLETGLNQAYIQTISADDFLGTALVLKLKNHYSSEKVFGYIQKTFQYPSVGIVCVDLDKLDANIEEMGMGYNSQKINRPHQLIHIVKDAQEKRTAIITPIQKGKEMLSIIEKDAEYFIDWISKNRTYEKARPDSIKFNEFKQLVKEMVAKIKNNDIKIQFPLSLSRISEKSLFNDTNKYIDSIDLFMANTRSEIAALDGKLSRYPLFYSKQMPNKVFLGGKWKYIVIYLDEDMQIVDTKEYNSSVDLSDRQGIVLMKHSYEDFDNGIEYSAVNGFLFSGGEIYTRMVKVTGEHEVSYQDVREKSFIICSHDSESKIKDALLDRYIEFNDDLEEEPCFLKNYDGDYIMGLRFAPSCSVIEIVNNHFELSESVDLSSNSQLDMDGFHSKKSDLSHALQPENLSIVEKHASVLDDFQNIDTLQSVYCQDGVAIPCEIDQLFPIGFFRLFCNTTYTARMTLNVTRHEPSQLKSDVETWFSNAGNEIQTQIYKSVLKMLNDVKLNINFDDLFEAKESSTVFGSESKINLNKLLHSNLSNHTYTG